MRWFIITLAMLVLIARPLAAQQFAAAGINDDSLVLSFFHDLQAAIRRADSQKVATLIKYPLVVNDSTGRQLIRTQQAFLRQYSRVITPSVRHAVLAQSADSLFANWQGVMIGRGHVWFGMNCLKTQPSACGRIGVEAINRDAPPVR